MSWRLTVLGARAGSPDQHGAASGYLLRTDDLSVLIDCGPGVLARLLREVSAAHLDAVIATHLHLDHTADLAPMSYHLAFPQPSGPVSLFAPTGFETYIDRLDDLHGIPTLDDLRRPLRTFLPLTTVEPGCSFHIDGLAVDTRQARHPVPTLTLRFPGLGLAYTADTALDDSLVEFVGGVDVLLAEATYPDTAGHDFHAHGHMSGEHAGELAANSGAGELILTHLSSFDPVAVERTVANAASRYDGPIKVAWPGTEFGPA